MKLSFSDFLETVTPKQYAIIMELHNLLTNTLGLRCKIRYNIPFYDYRTWVCYLNPIKKEGIELAFLRGKELSNNGGLLQQKDRKQVAGISLYHDHKLPLEYIRQLINEALILDEMHANHKK